MQVTTAGELTFMMFAMLLYTEGFSALLNKYNMNEMGVKGN
jgi:hypothetical protein